jgi:hypothetical protein
VHSLPDAGEVSDPCAYSRYGLDFPGMTGM